MAHPQIRLRRRHSIPIVRSAVVQRADREERAIGRIAHILRAKGCVRIAAIENWNSTDSRRHTRQQRSIVFALVIVGTYEPPYFTTDKHDEKMVSFSRPPECQVGCIERATRDAGATCGQQERQGRPSIHNIRATIVAVTGAQTTKGHLEAKEARLRRFCQCAATWVLWAHRPTKCRPAEPRDRTSLTVELIAAMLSPCPQRRRTS